MERREVTSTTGSEGVSGAGGATPKGACSRGKCLQLWENVSGPLREGKAFLTMWWLGAKAHRQTKSG